MLVLVAVLGLREVASLVVPVTFGEVPVLGLVARDWWVFAIRGIAALVFGILAFIWPERTLTVLVFLFGAYVLVDGVSLLIALARGDAIARRHSWAVAIMGVLGIVVGVVTFMRRT